MCEKLLPKYVEIRRHFTIVDLQLINTLWPLVIGLYGMFHLVHECRVQFTKIAVTLRQMLLSIDKYTPFHSHMLFATLRSPFQWWLFCKLNELICCDWVHEFVDNQLLLDNGCDTRSFSALFVECILVADSCELSIPSFVTDSCELSIPSFVADSCELSIPSLVSWSKASHRNYTKIWQFKSSQNQSKILYSWKTMPGISCKRISHFSMLQLHRIVPHTAQCWIKTCCCTLASMMPPAPIAMLSWWQFHHKAIVDTFVIHRWFVGWLQIRILMQAPRPVWGLWRYLWCKVFTTVSVGVVITHRIWYISVRTAWQALQSKSAVPAMVFVVICGWINR